MCMHDGTLVNMQILFHSTLKFVKKIEGIVSRILKRQYFMCNFQLLSYLSLYFPIFSGDMNI